MSVVVPKDVPTLGILVGGGPAPGMYSVLYS